MQLPPLVISPTLQESVKMFGKSVGSMVFQSGRSIQSALTKVKDTLPAEKQSKLIY